MLLHVKWHFILLFCGGIGLLRCFVCFLDDEDSPAHEATQGIGTKPAIDVSLKLCDAFNQSVSLINSSFYRSHYIKE